MITFRDFLISFTAAALLSSVSSTAFAESSSAEPIPYIRAGNTNLRGDACHATLDTNAAVFLLSGFLDIWTPRTPFVDAGVEAPAKDGCPAVKSTDWNGVPFSPTDGQIRNKAVHEANIAYVVKATRERTANEAIAAYLDDRRGKNASIVDGLGPLMEAWKAGSKQTTSITSVAADADKVKYEDSGNDRGFGSRQDTKANTPANPDLGLAVDLINAVSENGSTEPAKRYFKYARPFRWSNEVVLLPTLVPAKSSKPVEDGGFPSGHTAEAWRDALAMAYLVPQRYQEMLTRAFELGENRIRAGMHSPLDVMGGRMLGTAAVVYNLNRPDLGELKISAFKQAQTWLGSAVHAGSDSDLETLSHAAPTKEDRFSDHATNKAFVAARLTYGFPKIHDGAQAAKVPQGAEVLLETRQPYLNPLQRREVLATTEIGSGYPFLDDQEGYGRLNLFAAADGYGRFDGHVTVNMNASEGGFNAFDSWRNDISGTGGLTKKGTGTIQLTGDNSYSGGTNLEGGRLIAASSSALGTGNVSVSGGRLEVTAKDGVHIGSGYRQSGEGTLAVDLVSAKRERMVVSGPAKIAGTLHVSFAEGYHPHEGDRIPIFTAGSMEGKFDKLDIEGGQATLEYGPTGVVLAIE
ncbi:acid phosphatase [Oryzifoliimicrobium ureilyticus]|uniref:acid phosphatase n=1 Tax=Oryzifoliimicrobium ureilyticus TaxID=3113724 RepID=UPI0030765054